MTMDIVFYLVIGLSIIGYAILDGFDLGVGMLHLFAKGDTERRVFLNAIGPVWDGNEVWLVIVGGALFAGFPEVYATFFSAFYNLAMFLLMGLIFRAVAIEFRSKRPSPVWRQSWDVVFCVASYIIAFGIGIAMGNLIEGIPLDENKDFVGTFSGFFRPYTLWVGVMSIALFMMHGAIYLVMKTEGPLRDKLRRYANYCIIFFLAAYVITTSSTLLFMPHMTEHMREIPWLYLVGLFAILAILNVPRQMKKVNDGWAFLSSCFGIAFFIMLFGIGTFPYMVRSSIHPEANSLTIFNSASSPLTLKVLLWIVGIGVPIVLAYGFYIYRVFRGKVKIGPTSY
jgi:cytochrome bd ubiquinol oxidase subunit II